MIASRLRTDRVIVCGLLLACLLLLAAALPGNSGQAGQAARTAEGVRKSTDPNDALRQLLFERYHVLKDAVAHLQASAEQGREDMAGLRDFTVAMFHAEADLTTGPAERMKVYEKLVEFLSNYERHVERMAAAGRVANVDVSRAKILVLDAQIEIEKQRLARWSAK